LSVPCLAGALLCVVKSAASSAEVPVACAPEACGHTVQKGGVGGSVRFFFVHFQHPPRPFVHFFFTCSTHPARSFISFSLPQPPRPFVRFFFTSRREVNGRRCPREGRKNATKPAHAVPFGKLPPAPRKPKGKPGRPFAGAHGGGSQNIEGTAPAIRTWFRVGSVAGPFSMFY